MGEEGYWERDFDQMWGQGNDFKPRPIHVTFQDGGGTFKFLMTRKMFEQLKRESERLHMAYERERADRRYRENRERLAREQEEFRRKQERQRQERPVRDNTYTGNVFFGPEGSDFEDILRNIFEASEAFRGFTFTTGGSSTTGGTYTQPPRDKPPTPPKREQPKAWTRDGMMKRLCELAKVDYPSELEVKRLLRRAQRECHPDSGGSHDLWIELDELQRLLRI